MLREGIRVLSQALMEAEVAASIGVERHQRTGERTAYRNGSRTRTWDRRVGTIELAIPKGDAGQLLSLSAAADGEPLHGLLAVVQEAYVHRVSTRRVDELMKALPRRRRQRELIERCAMAASLSGVGRSNFHHLRGLQPRQHPDHPNRPLPRRTSQTVTRQPPLAVVRGRCDISSAGYLLPQ